MQNLDTRLFSFNAITKPKPKAKPAFPLSATTHPHLTPRALAEAGFYHSPGSSAASHDNCTCFLCNLELGGWDQDDDPFEEHAKRSGCAWAEMVCAVKIEKRKRDESNGQYVTVYKSSNALPQSAESIEVRIQTFKKWWPYKQKAGWLPSVKALARAGFVYYPSTESKDAVICPYCEYGVEGWEATDDPWIIHQSKVPDCHFFRATINQSEPSKDDEKISKLSRSQKIEASAPRRTRRGTAAAPVQPAELAEESLTAPSEIEDDVQNSHSSKTSKAAASSRVAADKKGGKGKKKIAIADLASKLESQPETNQETTTESHSNTQMHESAPARKTRGKQKAAAGKETSAISTKIRGRKEVEVEGVQPETYKEFAPEVPSKGEAELGTKLQLSSNTGPPEREGRDQPTPKAVQPSQASWQTFTHSKNISQQLPLSSQSSQLKSASQTQNTSKPLPSLPPPSPVSSPKSLSQLDRFANIPPSSPIPTPSRNKSTLRTAFPTKSSPQVLSQEDMNASLTRGALAVRDVVDNFSSPTHVASLSVTPQPQSKLPNNTPNGTTEPKTLTENQRNMTVEDLVRAEIKRGYEELMREGEEKIDLWEGRTRTERRRIEKL
ncbi:hypothetical protein L204_104291 [Cryptococcus depauperatus]|nr:hypothetical protein L204_04883 [Cryptococcus depauperatus CBS 7855]